MLEPGAGPGPDAAGAVAGGMVAAHHGQAADHGSPTAPAVARRGL